MQDSFRPVLAELVGVIRSGWTWPSPEVGFARYTFEQVGEPVPVLEDRGEWPVAERLDHAPVLASTGYLLSGQGRVLRPEWQRAWAMGFERLSERDAFPTDRLSFAFRPLYVLGIALGAAKCPLVGEPGRDWIRGVIRRLSQDRSTETWADLIYGTAARAVGVNWRDRLFVQLDGVAAEALGFLRWLVATHAAEGLGGLTDLQLVDAELVRRCAAGSPLPRDVAKAAVIYNSLRQALKPVSGEVGAGTAGYAGTKPSAVPITFDPAMLRGIPKDAGVTFNFFAGDQHMGDRISMRDNLAGAVGRGAAVIARDIAVYKNELEHSTHLDPDLKKKLIEAREEIERISLSDSEKEDAVDNLKKLTTELDKADRDPGLVKRYWNRVKEVAPTVAALLSTVASIAKIMSGS